MDHETEQRARRFVNTNVYCCVSGLIATLALGAHGAIRHNSLEVRNPRLSEVAPLMELADKAGELFAPVEDWEETAQSRGFVWQAQFDSAREACEAYGIDEPHYWEIFEHWVVSEYLANELEKRGERVDHDFEGLCVWGRTTTGQAIAADSVILDIIAEIERSAAS